MGHTLEKNITRTKILKQKGEALTIVGQSKTKKESTYYAEVSLAIKADSEKSLEEIESVFNQDGLRVKITLESGNGEEITPEVLEIWEVEWEEWDKL